MIEILRGLRLILSPADKWRMLGLVGLLTFGALLEIAGLGLLLPVVAAFTKPELFEQNRFLHLFRSLFAGAGETSFLLICCLLITLVYAGKNLWLYFTIHLYTKFVYGRLTDLTGRLYDLFLHCPYRIFAERGKVELNITINKVEQMCGMVMLPAMLITVDALTVLFISGALMVTIPGVVLGCAAFFFVGSLIFYLPVRRKSSLTGKKINALMSSITKLSFYSLEDIKSLRVLGAEEHFSRRFLQLRREKCACDTDFYVLGQIPRLLLETMAVAAALAVLAVMLWIGRPIGTVILSFGLLIAAMSRLLPSISRINYSLNTIRVGQPIFREIIDALQWGREELGDPAARFEFRKELRIRDLSFAYDEKGPRIIDHLNLTLPRNSSLAVVGPTGGGKSTFIDLLLGFYKPLAGTIEADGRNIHEALGAWRRLIGFVPQFIVLADASIAVNVAVGMDEKEIDRERVKKVLETAQLWEFVASLPQGMDTPVGDNGMRLSGGQRQRLGIARALYRDPEIIIFDEATSALDTETEEALINALEALRGRKTLIMVAHRLSTVAKCDQRLEIGTASAAGADSK